MRKKLCDNYASTTSYLEGIIAALPDYVYWMNTDYTYLGCNDNMAELYNLNLREDIIGKTYEDLYNKKSEEGFRKADTQVMTTGKQLIVEETLYSPDGVVGIYLSNKVALRDKLGNIIGMLGYSVDITEKKQKKQALNEAKDQSEDDNNAKTEFLCDMHHEVSRLNLAKENIHKFDKTLSISLRVIAGIPLTVRETQCVCLWLSGYSIKYTSRVLSISNKTVETYRVNILSKLGLFNKDQLISLVMAENTFYQYVCYAKYIK